MSAQTCNPEHMIHTETDSDGTEIWVCHDCGGAESREPDECPACEHGDAFEHWRACPRWDAPENGSLPDREGEL